MKDGEFKEEYDKLRPSYEQVIKDMLNEAGEEIKTSDEWHTIDDLKSTLVV